MLEALRSTGTSLDTLLPSLVALDRGNAAWVALVQEAAADDGAAGVSRVLRDRLLPGSPTAMRMPLARTPAEARLTSPGSGTPR